MNNTIRVQLAQIRLNLGEDKSALAAKAAKALRIAPEDILESHIDKLSLDARKKQDIHYKASLELLLPFSCTTAVEAHRDAKILPALKTAMLARGSQPLKGRPLVVGAGPCGLFAALLLAQEGYAPIVLEQGKAMEQRVEDVERLQVSGTLDSKSNVLFGEGGAGAFSDGKLTWRGKDARGRYVLQSFVDCGAPEEILYQSKAHIGTDLLRPIIVALREKIIALGGQFYFEHEVSDFECAGGKLQALKISGKDLKRLESNACILALGHSARAAYEALFQQGFAMQAKAFAIGLRIEHPQSMVDLAQYGAMAGNPLLPRAEYRLSKTLEGRGVYSFCMCPGGQVICSASERGGLCCNGMSEHARDAQNANAALIVQVGPADFGQNALDGLGFQRHWEEQAYRLGGGGYSAPVQTLGDFMRGEKSKRLAAIKPSYRPGYELSDLSAALPPYCVDVLRKALVHFGREVQGFDRADAVLTGVETRSSAPLRLLRNERCESPSHGGIYPAGEGAGYAGGIMSAAVDGLKAAECLMQAYAPPGTGMC